MSEVLQLVLHLIIGVVGWHQSSDAWIIHPCLLVNEDGSCFGGILRTSLLYDVICIQAMLLSCFAAFFCAFKTFQPIKPVDLRWIAGSVAGIVSGLFFLVAGVTGKFWLFVF